jgi:hypothetical protein
MFFLSMQCTFKSPPVFKSKCLSKELLLYSQLSDNGFASFFIQGALRTIVGYAKIQLLRICFSPAAGIAFVVVVSKSMCTPSSRHKWHSQILLLQILLPVHSVQFPGT